MIGYGAFFDLKGALSMSDHIIHNTRHSIGLNPRKHNIRNHHFSLVVLFPILLCVILALFFILR